MATAWQLATRPRSEEDPIIVLEDGKYMEEFLPVVSIDRVEDQSAHSISQKQTCGSGFCEVLGY